MRLLVSYACGAILCGGLLIPPSLAEPCTNPLDPCADELLDQFTPEVWFENEGMGGGDRLEWPIPLTADGDTVENNLELLVGPVGSHISVYRHAQHVERQGGAFWLLGYHYYYPSNYHKTWRCYLHEHDWEWVYVLAGWSNAKNAYIGYAAVLSSHDDDNIEAMEKGHTFLFPRVVLTDADWQSAAPYVSRRRRLENTCVGDSLRTAKVRVNATGNEFSPDREPADLWEGWGVAEAAPAMWIQGKGCGGWTTSDFCYGDPQVPWGDPWGSGSNECGDCGADRRAPWVRANMWDDSAIPADLWFPPPDCLKTGDPGAPSGGVAVDATEEGGGWRVAWSLEGGRQPTSFELVARGPGSGGSCRIGTIPWRDWGAYAAFVLYCGSDRDSSLEGDLWTLCSPCACAQSLEGGWIEIWVQWVGGDSTLLGRSTVLHPRQAGSAISVHVTPSPTDRGCLIRFSLPRPISCVVDIVGTDGRRVRCLQQGRGAAGWNACVWDGRDDRGRQVPAGMFWVRVAAAMGTEARRVVLLH